VGKWFFPIDGLSANANDSYQELLKESNDPISACGFILTLLLHFDGPSRRRQLDRLNRYADSEVVSEMLRLEPKVVDISWQDRIALVVIYAPALKKLSIHDRQRFLSNLRAIICADDLINLLEFAILLLVESQLDTPRDKTQQVKKRDDLSRFRAREPEGSGQGLSFEEFREQISLLFSVLARSVSPDDRSFLDRYRAGMNLLSLHPSHPPSFGASFEKLSCAVRTLRKLDSERVERVIQGCLLVVNKGEGEIQNTQNSDIVPLQALIECFNRVFDHEFRAQVSNL
jgi:hypothetical protein